MLVTLSAELQGDEVRARIQTVEPLDEAAAKLQKGLRVFLRNELPIDSIAKRLEPSRSVPASSVGETKGEPRRPAQMNGEGEVSMVLMLDRGAEVEVKLPGRFKVSPQIAGAIKAVPGVVAVEAT